MTDAESPTTRDAILERIRQSHAALTSLVDSLPAATLTEPGADGWTVTDQLAHVAAWEQSLLALLRGLPRYEAVGLDRETYQSLDTDGINARIRAANHGKSPAEVRALFEESHRELVGELERLGDADLQRPYSDYQPNDPPHDPDPVVNWIAGNTWEHYAEHIEIIQALANR